MDSAALLQQAKDGDLDARNELMVSSIESIEWFVNSKLRHCYSACKCDSEDHTAALERSLMKLRRTMKLRGV